MLLKLYIKDFAIIEDMNIDFTSGLNIISGETGSGKSLIIESLKLITGHRAKKGLIRFGKEKAVFQAVFTKNSLTKKLLLDYGIEDEDEQFIVHREITQLGNINRINNTLVTLDVLSKILEQTILLHTQNQNNILLDSKKHIDMLDLYIKNDIEKYLLELNQLFDKKKILEKEINRYELNPIERERMIDILRYQLDELDSIDLNKIDEVFLNKEFKRLSNINKLEETIVESILLLENESYGGESLIDFIRKVNLKIRDISSIDNNLISISERFNSNLIELEDIISDMRRYSESLVFDEGYLSNIESQLIKIEELKRKYGPSIDEIKKYKIKIEKELNFYEDSILNTKEIEKKLLIINEEILVLSKKISNIRKDRSRFLSDKIEKELYYLNMKNVIFKTNILESEHLTRKGIDRVEFLVSTNLGSSPKPLTEIASGGEVSRIMLAFESIYANVDKVETLVFDEIDTGISGHTAQLVAIKLKELSKRYQILVVTHLPQIASAGYNHILVKKTNINKETLSEARILSNQERVFEIARLLSGYNVTDLTLKHAEEMLDLD